MKNFIAKRSILNLMVAAGVVAVVAGLIVLVVKLLPLTGDEIAGQGEEDLVVQASLEMDETNVNTMTGGKVSKVCVKEGDVVSAGDVIAIMDSKTLLAKQQQAEASIKAYQGQLKAAQATYQKALNGATDEELAQAKAAYDYAEATYNRMQVMLETEAISQSEFDQVATQYEVAKQQYIAAQKGASQEDIAAAAAAVEAYQGQVEAAQGALAEVQSYLNETAITAPSDGVITTVNVSDGELTSTGLPIAVITSTDSAWISCKVMEDQLSRVQLQQKVAVTFPAYPEQTFSGTVTQINKNADFAVKRATNANGSFDVVAFSVKVELDPVEEALYSGMTAFVNFSDSEAAQRSAGSSQSAADGEDAV